MCAGRWTLSALSECADEELFKQCLAVDAPSAYHKSFRRLVKKGPVSASKRLGRILHQYKATGSVSCKAAAVKDLCYELEHGTAPEVSGHGWNESDDAS